MKNRLKLFPFFARFAFFTFLLLILTVELVSETQVSISISDNLATIGDRIRLKIIVKTTSEVDKITEKTTQKDFEVLKQAPFQKRKQQDYLVFEKEIEIAFFKTGDFNIGPFDIHLKKKNKVIETRETNSIPITIKSVLKEEDKDIKSLKSLIKIKGNPFYVLKYVIIAVVLIIAVILIILWIKKRRKKASVVEKPLLSPLEEFELRIKELFDRKLFEKGKMKLFFLDLTQIIKRFLHRTYQFNAEDFTTYETLYDLKKREGEVLILNNMEFLFNTSDLVKFAKFIPGDDVLGEVLKKIEGTIQVYKQRISTQEQAQEQEKAP